MNNREIQEIREQLADAWQGDPWFGRPTKQLLAEILESNSYEQPGGQHSIAQLVWHMANWRQFVLSRIHLNDQEDVTLYDKNDWRPAGPDTDFTLQKGLQQLEQTQTDLLQAFQNLDDGLLDQTVAGRSYSFRKLLYGVIQHDIYHLGQIAYLVKMLRAAS